MARPAVSVQRSRSASSRRALGAAALIAALLSGIAPFAMPADVADAAPVYSYFPTGVADDGKMLAVAGEGLSTLSGTTVTLSFSVDNTETDFQIGFFDGISASTWDMYTNTFPTQFRLYADPLGDGTGSTVVQTWTDVNMTDDSWRDFTVNTSSAARSPSGNYFYRLVVSGTNPSTNSMNAFKMRVEGYTYIIPTTVFGYIGAFPENDEDIVYPNWPTLTPTTYDGQWDFHMYLPEAATYLDLWDGDFDLTNDTNDPNTTYVPSFDPGAALLDAARPGSPTDDVGTARYLRTPNIRYSVIDPSGATYTNLDPSGTQEWELFRIETATSDPLVTDHRATSLPSGMYTVRATGVDMHNLNALRFDHPIIGVDASGRPTLPPAPFLVGDTVFNDINGDGVQNAGESGIAGVVLTLRDVVTGRVIAAATTDANGAYALNSWNGTYEVVVESANFLQGGALFGLVPTSPDPPARTVTVTNTNVTTADFAFQRPPATGLNVTPDQAGSMAPGQTIEYTFTVSNDTTATGVFALTAPSGLGWTTAIVDTSGSPLTSIGLGSHESTTVLVRVSVPAGTPSGTQDTTRLTATLSSDSSVRDSAMAVTTVRKGVLVEPDQTAYCGVGTTVSYTHTVTNSWPTVRTIDLTAVSSVTGWTTQLFAADGVTPITSVVVGPNGASADIVVKVTVPANATTGTACTTVVTASTGGDSDTSTDVTTARRLMTYDSNTYTQPEDTFPVGQTVYARAGGLASATYRMRWYDPAGNLIFTSANLSPTGGVVTNSYTTLDTQPTGGWTVVLQRRSGNTWSNVETTPFTVTEVLDAEITGLWATDAPEIGASIDIASAVRNEMTTPVLDSTVTYVIWWDNDADGLFDAGDLYIDSSGLPHTWDGLASVSTHVTTGIDVAATSAWTDPPWSVANTSFPNQGTYRVTATWTTASGRVIDKKTTEFYSIPTLGWPLFGLTIAGAAYLLWRRRDAIGGEPA